MKNSDRRFPFDSPASLVIKSVVILFLFLGLQDSFKTQRLYYLLCLSFDASFNKFFIKIQKIKTYAFEYIEIMTPHNNTGSS